MKWKTVPSLHCVEIFTIKGVGGMMAAEVGIGTFACGFKLIETNKQFYSIVLVEHGNYPRWMCFRVRYSHRGCFSWMVHICARTPPWQVGS
jgi:hypothetical protein